MNATERIEWGVGFTVRHSYVLTSLFSSLLSSKMLNIFFFSYIKVCFLPTLSLGWHVFVLFLAHENQHGNIPIGHSESVGVWQEEMGSDASYCIGAGQEAKI